MSTDTLEDIEVILDESPLDEKPICTVTDECGKRAEWVPVCPSGHLVMLKTTGKPAYLCGEHAKQYVPGLLSIFALNGILPKCGKCMKFMDGNMLPVP